jgi:hypothetical protein
MGEVKNIYIIPVGNRKGNGPLNQPRTRREGNIKRTFQNWDEDWIRLERVEVMDQRVL